MAGIMDFFKQAATESNTNANTQPNANKDTNTPDGSISAQKPTADANGKMPGTDQTLENPLDVYAKMWENSNKTPDIAPSFTLDDKTLNDVSSKLDFTTGISPDLMQKATAGDVNALISIMNAVGQNSYRTALAHNSKLTDTFVGKRSEFDLKNVGSTVTGELTKSAIAAIPNASHPVVKRELNRVAEAMRASNPEATPQQIAEAASNYMKDLVTALNGGPPKTEQQQQDADAIDWEKYLKQ